jgi:hypothetical protein
MLFLVQISRNVVPGAERALRLANLVKLQIQRPNLRLLFDNGADVAKLTVFAEACIVAKVTLLLSSFFFFLILNSFSFVFLLSSFFFFFLLTGSEIGT